MRSTKEFDEAVSGLPVFILTELEKIPTEIKTTACEVRFRSGRRPQVCFENKEYSLPKMITQQQTAEIFKALCGYSIHSKMDQIKQGFITIRGGHRAGISGTAVYEKGKIVNIVNINSINLRIARQVYGAADKLFELLHNNIGKTLIAGPPGSGKTTILKDIARQIKGKRVSIVDTRGEIAAVYCGSPQNDVSNADVFDGYRRDEGMNMAIRTMGPDLLICDELGNDNDLKALKESVGAGVEIIASVHSFNEGGFKNRKLIEEILKTGAFERIVTLSGRKRPSAIKSIEGVKLYNENNRSGAVKSVSDFSGVLLFKEFNADKERIG